MPNDVESWVKMSGAVVAVATFIFGIYTYAQTAKQSEQTNRIAASKPFLEKQLALFTDATVVASVIATSDNQDDLLKARSRFMQLYWGELGMVERGAVATAMIEFKKALDSNKPKEDLQRLSLGIAHACRDELGKAWGTDVWNRR
jgi:hypothetical protein